MKRYPIVLSIAGSDCSGGAGIQADIKTISALGGYAASVITAVTVQNTLGVQKVHHLPPEIVEGQIEAVISDLRPDAIKIGMIDNDSTLRVIVQALRRYGRCPVVYDPVMVSTSGHRLMEASTIEEIKRSLFPLTTLVTPNLAEAAVLSGTSPDTPEEMATVAAELSERFRTSVLIKGGHLPGDETCDVLHALNGGSYIYKGKRIRSRNLHGTGCTLSSAIATRLAMGYPMDKAVEAGKEYVSRAIAAGKELNIGGGNGPLWHFPEPETSQK